MMRASLTQAALLCAISLGAPALAPTAASAAAAAVKPADVRPGVYAIEPTHTRVLFSVDHFGFSTWYGNFTGASGSMTLDPKTLSASKVDVSVPVASVSTTNTALDGELKSADYFDAARFPTMTFHSTKVTQTSPTTADVAGDLTLHGVTKPVVLKATFHGAGPDPLSQAYMVGFDITGRITRSDFGVKTFLPLVGDQVDLILSASFKKNP